MEAKETVMKRMEVRGYSFGDKVWEMIQEQLEAQAEISFKAGYFEGRGLGIRDGIREVVEWLEKDEGCGWGWYHYGTDCGKAVAKGIRKEWGD